MAPKRSLPQASSSMPKRKKVDREGDDGVHALEVELTQALESSTSLNPLTDLIALAASDDAAIVHKAIYALYRVFVNIIDKGLLSNAAEKGSDAALVKAWLIGRWDEFVDLLGGLLHHTEPSIRTAALEIVMSVLKPLSTSLSKRTSQPRIDAVSFRRLTRALLIGPTSSASNGVQEQGLLMETDVRELFLEKWLSVHDDIRWFFLREATELLTSTHRTTPPSPIAQNVLSLLERMTTMPTIPKELNTFWIAELSSKPSSKPAPSSSTAEEEADPSDWLSYFDEPELTTEKWEKPGKRVSKLSVLQSLHYLPSHRGVFSECWLALLRHLRTSGLVSRALSVLHKNVLPHFTRPLRLMDWIAACVDHGGVIGLLALNGLFTLIKDHNLDYPDFYKRLYGFLTRDVLHLKHRARFFRLTELFLSSTHLPVALLASFVKRLARLSLSAPPAAIVMIVPFTYNLLKQHPSLMQMIHREPTGEEDDPFDANESDPMLTNAISSSLWELNSHREHYLASISTMARILSEPFTKPSYALEDFLDHTYGTMFEAEVKRRIKRDPALAMDYDGQIFPSSMLPIGAEREDGSRIGDVVADLWGFGVAA